ncbi:hypothetical protein BO79DRAFT_49252 [Aspergillus costaricaensis CBS 115574]|uniref:Uncharacterized protein n=1 Tax=Aspergillus costaricaensis CBS 115574 TaxID=1448317 RepID=A0ACD1I4A4_9EURO|nr:hypothetical protein BO79DRAFT_49252 [Aspergillus costaricaensis CBS 115574]RAK85144.1 hypothetical protein BO79DRAFT_49252 [Aspergillus costaricaensis CBS 115574]
MIPNCLDRTFVAVPFSFFPFCSIASILFPCKYLLLVTSGLLLCLSCVRPKGRFCLLGTQKSFQTMYILYLLRATKIFTPVTSYITS